LKRKIYDKESISRTAGNYILRFNKSEIFVSRKARYNPSFFLIKGMFIYCKFNETRDKNFLSAAKMAHYG